MDISFQKKDDLNGVLSVKISKQDYAEQFNKTIKDHAKKMSVRGFRQGMVPLQHIQKLYGESILVEQISKILNDQITAYIDKNSINTLGQPIPVAEKSIQNVFEFGNDFEFDYEMGVAPDFNLEISSKDKFHNYQIEIDDKILDSKIDNLRKSFGTHENPDKSEKDDILFIEVEQVHQDKSVVENGIKTTGSLWIADMADDNIKASLLGLQIGDEPTIDLVQAFNDDAKLLRLFNVSEDGLADIKNSFFKVKINNIRRVKPAEVNQEFFDKLYGAGNVQSEEEFKNRVIDELNSVMLQNADARLAEDIRKYFSDAIKITLPDDFLKRWLKYTNEKISPEEIESGYEQFSERLKWELIENKLIKDNEIKIAYDELLATAEKRIEAQLKMYGSSALPEQFIQQYAKEFLNQKENANKIFEEVKSLKVFEQIKSLVTLEPKKITYTEFVALTH